MTEQRLSDLIGHEIMIVATCRCTKVVDFCPARLTELLGVGATLATARARLICKTCRQRPALLLERTWATSGGRDGRRDPPSLPAWAAALLGG